MIKVGSIKSCTDTYFRNLFPDYIPIMVMTKSSAYGELGPYVLTDENGSIMENIWQFSKCYEKVPQSTQRYSRWDPTIVWDHPAEVHCQLLPDDEILILESYWNWRQKGFENPYPVRYPVGMYHRKNCLFSLKDENSDPIGLFEARKEIYYETYSKLAKEQPLYRKLEDMLEDGKNLLIMEVDGPQEQSLNYYQQKYNVPDDWITNKSIDINESNMNILLNDGRHSFGHGFCLASSLLKIDLEIKN